MYCLQCDNNHCEYLAIKVCEHCQVLGDSAGSLIFVTISPDPYRDNYIDRLPAKQYRYLESRIKMAMVVIRQKYKSAVFTRHYELNKNGEVHCHGIMKIDSQYAGYDMHLKTISKIFNRYFGRLNCNSNIACPCYWVKDLDHVTRYINKENVFTPVHDDLNKTLEDYFKEI